MKPDTTKPSVKLSAEAMEWWKRLRAEYTLDDEAGLLVLEVALSAFDRMRAAQRLIEAHGVLVPDRFGALKSNPAIAIERDSRAAMLKSLKALNLDLEPLRDGPGRPGKSSRAN